MEELFHLDSEKHQELHKKYQAFDQSYIRLEVLCQSNLLEKDKEAKKLQLEIERLGKENNVLKRLEARKVESKNKEKTLITEVDVEGGEKKKGEGSALGR